MIRAPIPGLSPGKRRLEGAVAHYLARVLRVRAGDRFVAFDPESAQEADATTMWAADDGVTVTLGPLRPGATRAASALVWIQGLAKGDKCDAVVRDATELGATRIIVAATRRSVVKLDADRASERQSRWARVAAEASRQCGRSDAPGVDAPCPWPEALARVETSLARFVLWEGAVDPLGPRLLEALGQGRGLAFACGAEGGLEAGEVQQAVDAGWQVASLGPFTLRTETVAAAVLGAVCVLTARGRAAPR